VTKKEAIRNMTSWLIGAPKADGAAEGHNASVVDGKRQVESIVQDRAAMSDEKLDGQS
jgi:hypothetical protein